MVIYLRRYFQVYLPICTYICPCVHGCVQSSCPEHTLEDNENANGGLLCWGPQIRWWSSHCCDTDGEAARDGLRGRSKGTAIAQNLMASPQQHWNAQRKALPVLRSCCCGRYSLLQSALIHSVEDEKEGDKKAKMRKATCRGRWWGGNRKFFSRAV